MDATKNRKLVKVFLAVTIMLGLILGTNSADARGHRRRHHTPSQPAPAPTPTPTPTPTPAPGGPGGPGAPAPAPVGFSVKTVVQSADIAPGADGTVSAPCPAGTQLVGGGAALTGPASAGFLSTSSGFPIRNAMTPDKGWMASAHNQSTDTTITMAVTARCATGIDVQYVVDVTDISPGVAPVRNANCPAGTKLLAPGVYQDSIAAAARINTISGSPDGSITSTPSSGAQAWVQNLGQQIYGLYTLAICGSSPTLNVTYIRNSAAVPGFQIAQASAVCPDGAQLLGGGAYQTRATNEGYLNSAAPIAQTFTARVGNVTGNPRTMFVTAICATA